MAGSSTASKPPTYRGDTDTPTLLNTAALADHAARDPAFLAVARVYAGRDDFDLTTLVTELVLSESVPALPALRFTESGLRLREVWEQVWDLQRREDAGETVTIPVPPKYGSGDFRDAVYWRMRGKLDVPKERFNVYPYAARPGDRGAWVTWAGLDHLQRARALAGAYLERKDHDGWSAVELTPFLAELDQLVPWLKQWHNEPDPDFGGTRMGDYYAEFVTGQIHAQGLRLDEVRAWAPSANAAGAARRGIDPRAGREKGSTGARHTSSTETPVSNLKKASGGEATGYDKRESIRTQLREHYKDRFPVLKELFQNADDAGRDGAGGRAVAGRHRRGPLTRCAGAPVSGGGPGPEQWSVHGQERRRLEAAPWFGQVRQPVRGGTFRPRHEEVCSSTGARNSPTSTCFRPMPGLVSMRSRRTS